MYFGLEALPPGILRTQDVGGEPVLFCQLNEQLYAYGMTCPGCGQPLEGGRLDDAILACPICQQKYDLIHAGRSVDISQLHLRADSAAEGKRTSAGGRAFTRAAERGVAMSAPNAFAKPGAAVSLRDFARRRVAVERCELCSKEIGAIHDHLFEPVKRNLVCSCEGCALLFTAQADTKFRRVPKLSRYLSGFRLSDAQWNSLMIPIEMAFFFYSSPLQRMVAFYPSPGGSHGIAAGARHLGRSRREQLDFDAAAAGCGGAARESSGRFARRGRRILHGPDRRVLQARGRDPPLLARTFGRNGNVARDRKVLRGAETTGVCAARGCECLS